MQAMAFTDATVVGITLLMLLGAVGYYLYHRIDMLERKIGLMENILLDLKVATEQTLLASSEPPERDSGPRMGLYSELSESHEQQHQFRPPTPRGGGEDEVFPASNEGAREVFFDATPRTRTPPQSVQVAREPVSPVAQSSVSVNYESMTYKELTSLAKQRSLSGLRNASKAQVIDALRRNDNGEAPLQLSDNQSVVSGGANLRTLDLSSFVTQAPKEQELQSAEPELNLAPLDASEAEPIDDSFVRSS